MCFAALAALVVPQQPADAQDMRFGQGNWRVLFFYQDETELAGELVSYSGHGSMFLNVVGSEASGEWNLSLDSTILDVGAPTHADAVGTIEGPRSRPVLPLEHVTVTEPSIGMTISFTADELPTSGIGELVVAGGGCNALTGDWLIPFQDNILEGNFIAEPLGSAEPSAQADLRDDGLTLIEDAKSGVIDPGALAAFVAAAEEQANRGTARRDDCEGATARMYGTAATLLLDAVLKASAYALEDADRETFVDLYLVAVRSGFLEVYPGVRDVWELQLLSRLSRVMADGTLDDWKFWLPVAAMLGEDRAAATLQQLICDEEPSIACGDR